jgi:hypothetical protein
MRPLILKTIARAASAIVALPGNELRLRSGRPKFGKLLGFIVKQLPVDSPHPTHVMIDRQVGTCPF